MLIGYSLASKKGKQNGTLLDGYRFSDSLQGLPDDDFIVRDLVSVDLDLPPEEANGEAGSHKRSDYFNSF